jgi:hypothetical protein
MRPITLTEAMRDVNLLGGPFAAPSFWPWFTIAKLLDGLPLDEREAELSRQCTGRTVLPSGPVRRMILLAGRRAGKDRFLSAVAVHRAALAADWRQHVSAGEQAVVLLLGADKKQAGILRRYCEGLLAAPLLAHEVSRRTDEVTGFNNGAVLEIATNDARLVRGRSAIAVLGSEASHWRVDEAATSSDEEVVAAAGPSMAMCPDGGVLLLGSSVHRKRGYMHRRWKELHGNDEAEDVCWLAPSNVMNPALPAKVIEKALADDPARARAEYLSEWREDLSDFIPADVVEGATDFGVRERAPLPGVRYFAYCDAAGGTGQDSFALAIGHRAKDGALMIDVLRERRPRFIPAAVVAELAVLLRFYKISKVEGDRFAGGFHADEWKRSGITYEPCERTTSENYLTTLPLLLNGKARLLDDATLRKQLVGLERRVHAGGRESVSHAGAASAHDDVAAAACGVLAALAAKGAISAYASHEWVGDGDDGTSYYRNGQRYARFGRSLWDHPAFRR